MRFDKGPWRSRVSSPESFSGSDRSGVLQLSIGGKTCGALSRTTRRSFLQVFIHGRDFCICLAPARLALRAALQAGYPSCPRSHVFTFAPQARKAGCRLWSSAGISRWSMQIFRFFSCFPQVCARRRASSPKISRSKASSSARVPSSA